MAEVVCSQARHASAMPHVLDTTVCNCTKSLFVGVMSQHYHLVLQEILLACLLCPVAVTCLPRPTAAIGGKGKPDYTIPMSHDTLGMLVHTPIMSQNKCLTMRTCLLVVMPYPTAAAWWHELICLHLCHHMVAWACLFTYLPCLIIVQSSLDKPVCMPALC